MPETIPAYSPSARQTQETTMTPYIDWTFLISLVLALGAGLTGWSMWLRERRRTLPSADADFAALREDDARFHSELEEHLGSFEQRIEFLERRLAQHNERPRLLERNPVTPV